jgi:hypothetical protein
MLPYLLDSRPHLLTPHLKTWLESPRYAAFAETYRDKIRKKIRLARDRESILDLRAELEVPYHLLNDRRLSVAYEPYASLPGRGPDYAVIFRTNLVFNLEVARLRPQQDANTDAAALKIEERLLRLLLDKLGQMHPNMSNLLAVHVPDELAIDLPALLQALKVMADRKDPAFYAAARYATPAAFYRDFTRLSAVLLWPAPSQLWVNKQSRPPLPDKVLRLVVELLSG